MEIYTKGNGKMTKRMAKESFIIQMAQYMKDIGSLISKMALEFKHGQMELFTKDSM